MLTLFFTVVFLFISHALALEENYCAPRCISPSPEPNIFLTNQEHSSFPRMHAAIGTSKRDPTSNAYSGEAWEMGLENYGGSLLARQV
jgi:hypothetical protein